MKIEMTEVELQGLVNKAVHHYDMALTEIYGMVRKHFDLAEKLIPALGTDGAVLAIAGKDYTQEDLTKELQDRFVKNKELRVKAWSKIDDIVEKILSGTDNYDVFTKKDLFTFGVMIKSPDVGDEDLTIAQNLENFIKAKKS